MFGAICFRRLPIAFSSALLLAGCQTAQPQRTALVQPRSDFTERQVAALEAQGFHESRDGYELNVENRILFGFDERAVTPDSAVMLRKMAVTLLGVGIHGAEVEGHTDSIGAASYNLRLSRERAVAVGNELIAGGMAPDHIRIIGRGATDPIASNETEAGRQENRRVVILVSPADAAPLR